MRGISNKLLCLTQEAINEKKFYFISETIKHVLLLFEELRGIQNTGVCMKEVLSKFKALALEWLHHQVGVPAPFAEPTHYARSS